MWQDSRLCAQLGIEHPILQAPMAGASTPALVAAVSNCGGLGGLGAAGMSPDVLRRQVQAIKDGTDRPFNVNLFNADTEQFDHAVKPSSALTSQLEKYHREYGLGEVPAVKGLFGPAQSQLEVLLEEGVAVISLHFGTSAETVQRIHETKAQIVCSATTATEARQLEDIGVDVIVAQGGESGGHRGSDHQNPHDKLVGTMALVPAIVDALSVPVVAAGGIMDARGMVAAAALGAAGVQLGTVFLGCPEAGINDTWLAQLEAAEGDDTGVTEVISGKPARGIRNRYVEELEALNTEVMPYPAQYSLSRDLRSESVRRSEPDFQALWAGQGVGLFRRSTVTALMEELVSDSAELAGNLGS
jgi:nitronate monooxygenase